MQLLPISRTPRSFSNFRKSKSVTSPLSSPISVFRSIIFQQHFAYFVRFHVPSGCTWKWAAGLQALHALRAHESLSKSNVFPWVIHLDWKPTGMLNPNSNIGTVRRMPFLALFLSVMMTEMTEAVSKIQHLLRNPTVDAPHGLYLIIQLIRRSRHNRVGIDAWTYPFGRKVLGTSMA